MGDFIKELNIIDFLGMLLPGSIFLILSGQGEEVLRLCQVFFGETNNQVAVGTFLIVAGYLVGMLVHEVGDLTERGLWHISWLDPKYYAAKAVGLEKLLEKYKESSKEWPAVEEKTNKLQTIWWTAVAFGSTIFYEWVLLMAFQVNPCTWPRLWPWPWWGWGIAIAIPVVLLKITANSEEARELHHANQWIQTEMVDKQNCKKRVVFDGFHVMMRNLILVIALLNYMQAAKLSIPQCVGRIIVVIMLVRYMHYSYLKYKYSYEDYLKELAQKEKKAEEKGPAEQTVKG